MQRFDKSSANSNSEEGISDSRATSPTLLAGIGDGQSNAWERLVAFYRPTILSWCRSKGLDEATSLDVAQETFISVSKSLATFQSTPGSGAFRAWLWRITQYRIIDQRRQQVRQPKAIGGSSNAAAMGIVPEFCSDSESNFTSCSPSLAATLEKLSKGYETRTWRAFLRNIVDGRPTEEVAAEFEMSTVGVRQLRSRILRRLRKELSLRNPETHGHRRNE